uniref:Uncharacterized protein n=1 Tax=Leptobrachium leishanense TaxID=445787 RepID=A0A8C5PGG4_9ANUR
HRNCRVDRITVLQGVTYSIMDICVFWDGKRWSTNGCDTKPVNSTHTLCSCSHLSSFAILTSFEKEHKNVLTFIGLSVSILCLTLSFLTFVLCRALRSAHTSVLLALIGCLFLAQLLFLLGTPQTWNRVSTFCSIIAGGLHFFFLCAFSWMSVESILLFLTVRNLQAMNYLTTRRSLFPLLCAIGFGVPVVIVTISAAIQPLEYGTSKACWLSSKIIWSFLGPVLAHIVVSLVMFIHSCSTPILRLSHFCSLKTSRKSWVLQYPAMLLIFKSLAQVLLLGCTWLLGYFQLGAGAPVMAYLFILLNSLQGFFIFLVHCLLNRQVRIKYRASKAFYLSPRCSTNSTFKFLRL